MLIFSGYWVYESNYFITVFLIRSVKLYINLRIGLILGNNYPLANLPYIQQYMPAVCPTQTVAWFTMEWTHK